MNIPPIETILSEDPALRDRDFFALMQSASPRELFTWCDALEDFRAKNTNLYSRVRASLFLQCAYRYALLETDLTDDTGTIDQDAFEDILERRFEPAIQKLRARIRERGPNAALISALAAAYHQLTFQTLTDQVRRSVRQSLGNQWMFRTGHVLDHPVRVVRELLTRDSATQFFPILRETTPVRLDLSHSGWSDIFFLGMDYPRGARVINISVDLAVRGRDERTAPPITCFLRVIEDPVIRLTSIDLAATKDITDLADLYNFGNDYLGLLKAGLIASGIIPPAFEGSEGSLPAILSRVIAEGFGLELVTRVGDIPKGSRLAVSTNLLASIIAVLMRATGQTETLEGPLREPERRLVVSRAILGEWLGGSGGGWQDSGGVWPGIKIIEGVETGPQDPEHGISRGCLLPRHRVLGEGELHPETEARLAESLVLFHGGMAQNVGPILEMVTERYLLRQQAAWKARAGTQSIFDGILGALRDGDMRTLGGLTTANWEGPLKTIIPWVTTRFTETIIDRAKARFGSSYWGFLMLGGMSGGGMGMFTAPEERTRFQDGLQEILIETKRELEDGLPFAMDPVLYSFTINEQGTTATLRTGENAFLEASYYALHLPRLARVQTQAPSPSRRREMLAFTSRAGTQKSEGLLHAVCGNLFGQGAEVRTTKRAREQEELERLKREHGFDSVQHESIRAQLRSGQIGLARNRLPIETDIEDVRAEDLLELNDDERTLGEAALRDGRVAILTLAAGTGSRWSGGAGVVKAINPFAILAGKHRTFLEIHIAKSKRTRQEFGGALPHVVATSFLTHAAIGREIERERGYGYGEDLVLSPGKSIGQRLIPMARDLVALWEEAPQERLDPEKEKVRDHVRRALMDWAVSQGEGEDYAQNLPLQCLHPTGHWFEVATLFKNGVLATLLRRHRHLQTLMLHNVDTLGAAPCPNALGKHLGSGNALTFEVVPRHFEDRGGGLARVQGKPRLVEGFALPREDDELRLRYYNSMTTWIQIDDLLQLFGLTRESLLNASHGEIEEKVRQMAARMPTYVTIKDVKWRWGHGQEDVYPVAQFEKLWGDMTALPEARCGYLAVARQRGGQLKDPAQLDAWVTDGTRDHVLSLCRFGD